MNTKFVSVDEVVATAESFIGPVSATDRNLMRQWAYLGLRNIGASKAWVETCVIYPKELEARKPDDMYKAIDLALYNASNVELYFAFRGTGTRIHSPKNLQSRNQQYLPEFGAVIDVSEDNFYFHLGSNGSDVAYIKLKYFKLPIDENGLPLIPEDHVLAIAFFIQWIWSKRKGDNRSEIDQNKRDWKIERAKVRSANNMPSQLETDEINRKWMSMIPNFNLGQKSF